MVVLNWVINACVSIRVEYSVEPFGCLCRLLLHSTVSSTAHEMRTHRLDSQELYGKAHMWVSFSMLAFACAGVKTALPFVLTRSGKSLNVTDMHRINAKHGYRRTLSLLAVLSLLRTFLLSEPEEKKRRQRTYDAHFTWLYIRFLEEELRGNCKFEGSNLLPRHLMTYLQSN